MKLLFLLFFCFTMMNQVLAQYTSEDILKIIEQTKIKYAPDKRTAVFNINYELDASHEVHLYGETNIPEAKQELLTKLGKEKVVDEIELLPSKNLGEKIFGIVNLSVVNVKTKPEHSSELATQVPLGAKLKILKSSSEWYLVQCEDDYIGWIDDDGVCLMDKKSYEEWNYSPKVIVTSPFIFAFEEKNTNSFPVSDLVQGNILKKISQEGDFTRVEYPDGRKAFIAAADIQDYDEWLASRTPSFDTINKSAHSLMGLPYIWGGTSIKGVDCSGFTKIVFKSQGIELPRDASQQVHVGEIVNTQNGFDNLLPGDLLFFGTKDHDSGKEKITHVAIYLGNLEFIHSSGRVRINSFDKTKSNFVEGRLRTFIKAKRILTSLGKNGVKLTKDLN